MSKSIMLQKINPGRKYAIALLITSHIAGVVGMTVVDARIFAALTPFNLLLSSAIIISGQKGAYKNLLIFFISTFTLGFLVELMGIKTGFPFGSYYYGDNLGIKIFGVPLLIGVNWFLMVIGSGYLIRLLTSAPVMQILGGALLMTLIDFLIEPLAPTLDFWYWTGGYAPIYNYVGWFCTSIIMHWIFYKTIAQRQNILAIVYIISVTIFFFTLLILL